MTHRLNWLFISKRTARHMRWHKEGIHENDGVMVHPSDVRHERCSIDLMQTLPVMQEMFASDWRQMALIHKVQTLHHTLAGPSLLCHTTYHHLCMKFEFMFLCLTIPSLKAPSP
jgi:hypothetical protein